mgnify:CR=1 FL=1
MQKVERATTIAEGGVNVHTVEHVLSALTGMGVRFTGFESDSDLLLGLGLTRLRTVLH